MTMLKTESATLQLEIKNELEGHYREWDDTVSNADIMSSVDFAVRVTYRMHIDDLPLDFKNYLGVARARPELRHHRDQVDKLLTKLNGQ